MEWLPKDHLVYFILDVMEQLNLGEIEQEIQNKDPRGERPYAIGMMIGLLLYGYCVEEFSSRRMARATYEDVAFQVISAGQHPHFTTINQFRLDHGEAVGRLFEEVLRLCRAAGLVKLGSVALDGTKIKAAASKHKAMSYKRMNEEEARLKAQVQEWLRRAEEIDRHEDELYGRGKDKEDLPAELARRETRLQRLREAKTQLEKEAAEGRAAELREQAARQRARIDDESLPSHERKRSRTRAEKAERQADALQPKKKKDGDEGGGSQQELPLHRVASEVDGRPKPTAQRNFTDPDSCIMVKDGAYIQAYNAQITVDEAHQVILAHGVSNQSPDQEYLVPMMERLQGPVPQALLADTGYFSADNVQHLQDRRIDPYIAAGREEGAQDRPPTDPRTPAGTQKASMREKLSRAPGKAIYSRRKVIVEPVFGQIEQARGFRRFSQRGLMKVRREWALVCLTHNLLKLFRHRLTDEPEPTSLAPCTA